MGLFSIQQAIQNKQMSYGRNIEPQLLSIEAIIQKSEFKSKILNHIPVDLKKLFMQQANKNSIRSSQQKRISLLYDGLHSQTIQHEHRNNNARGKKSMPPLPSRQIKSQSLNSSMSKNNRNTEIRTVEAQRSVYTTRTNVHSRENSRKRINRKSLGEEVNSDKVNDNQNIFDIQNQNFNGNAGDIVHNETKNEQVDAGLQKQSRKKFHRFQYELVLPEKDKKDRGFRKVNQNIQKLQDKLVHHTTHENENKTRTITEQIETEQNILKQNQKHHSHNNLNNIESQNPLSRKKQVIPDFLLAAIAEETKKPSSISPSKIHQAQFYELNVQPPNPNQRAMRQPACIVNMKKKISYNRFRRSEQSCECEQILEPKANLYKLIEKDRDKEKVINGKKITDAEKEKKLTQSKDRLPLYRKHKAREKKLHIEEDVKGWDIVDGPQYYEQY